MSSEARLLPCHNLLNKIGFRGMQFQSQGQKKKNKKHFTKLLLKL